MENYQNSRVNSAVSAYEIGLDYIRVKFTVNPKIYSYSYNGKAGEYHLEQMKSLAKGNSGPNAYINKYVKNLYD